MRLVIVTTKYQRQVFAEDICDVCENIRLMFKLFGGDHSMYLLTHTEISSTSVFGHDAKMHDITKNFKPEFFTKVDDDIKKFTCSKTAFKLLLESNMLDENTLIINFPNGSIPYSDIFSCSTAEIKMFKEKGWDFSWSSILEEIKKTNARFITFRWNNVNFLWNDIYNNVQYDAIGNIPIPESRCSFDNIDNIGEMNFSRELITQICINFIQINKINLADLSFLFSGTEAYEKTVDIFLTKFVEYARGMTLNISYNFVIAEIWHSFTSYCNMFVSRRKQIRSLEKMIVCNSAIQQLYRTSFCRKRTIKEIVATKFNKRAIEYKYLANCSNFAFGISDLREMFTSFDTTIVRNISIAIANAVVKSTSLSLRIYENEYDDKYPMMPLPETSEETGLFFKLLLHIFVPGYIAGPFETGIIAMLFLNNEHIADIATVFLKEIKGSWFGTNLVGKMMDASMSSVSILFVDFLRTYSRFLTDDEIYYLNTCGNARCLHNIFNKPLCGLALNKPNFSEYRCFLPTKAEPLEYLVSIGQCTYPIHSFECSKCGMHRAINHQVIGSTICSFCVQNKSCVSADPLRCYINECDKCSSYYTSVIRLNHSFQSLCYFCLTGGIPPSVECVSCKYKFIVPNWRDPIYQCLACKMNKGTTNPCIVRNCILKDFISFKDDILNRIVGLSITEIADAINTIDSRIFFTMLQNVTFARMASEANRTYVFAETKEAIAELFSQFGSKCKQTVHTDCFLCCRQLPQCYTIKLCGSQKCSGNYCVTCAYSIQKKVIPGKLVNYSDCCCPFCKNVFNFNPETITYDLPILKLKVPSSAQKDSEVNYMAWCKQCNILKGHSQLRCQEETPVVENWICEDCVNPIKQVVRTVTCSHCKKNVYKVISENGVVSQHCNHLQCWGCGWHVCAFESCGKAFGTSGICYDHMKQVHGGNYDRR